MIYPLVATIGFLIFYDCQDVVFFISKLTLFLHLVLFWLRLVFVLVRKIAWCLCASANNWNYSI